MDGDVEPCWIYEEVTPGWDAETYWPESALEILYTSVEEVKAIENGEY